MLLAQVATILLVGPFTGQASEGFEASPLCQQLTCVPGRILGGQADLCVSGVPPGEGNCTIASSLTTSFCTTTPQAGSKFLWSQTSHFYSSYVEITFDKPVQRFGGYFGSWSIINELDFDFYAEDGTLTENVHFNRPANCVWTWGGFDLKNSEPCKRVRIYNNAWLGLNMDGLQVDWAPATAGTDTCFPGFAPVLACPCSLTGTVSNGCGNSTFPGGAHITSSGVASIATDTVVFSGNHLIPGVNCSLLQAGLSVRTSSVVYGNGVACWSSPPVRLFTGTAIGGSFTAPTSGQPTVSARSARYGHPLSAGTGASYWMAYRDFVPVGSCAAGMLNVTQGHNIIWKP